MTLTFLLAAYLTGCLFCIHRVTARWKMAMAHAATFDFANDRTAGVIAATVFVLFWPLIPPFRLFKREE